MTNTGKASGCSCQHWSWQEMPWKAHYPIRGATSAAWRILGGRSEYFNTHKQPLCMPDCDTRSCIHRPSKFYLPDSGIITSISGNSCVSVLCFAVLCKLQVTPTLPLPMSMGVGAPVASNAYKRTFFSMEFTLQCHVYLPVSSCSLLSECDICPLIMADCICVMFLPSA